MNGVDWRTIKPSTKLLIDLAEYEFESLTKDGIVVLRQLSGLRQKQQLTIAEARQLANVTVVDDVEQPAEIFHNDDLLRLNHLSDRDHDQTLERMALIESARAFEAANPSATKSQIANHARKAAFNAQWAMKFNHRRKSGLKTTKCEFSARTAEHYLLQFERSGLNGLISRESSHGKLTITPRADPIFITLAGRASAEWRDGRLLNKKEAWKVFLGLVAAKFNNNTSPPGVISRRTFERWLDTLPKYNVLSDRHGTKYADDKLQHRDVRRAPQHAFDEVEMDCKFFDAETKADPIIQFAATGSTKKSRPVLVAMVDRKTGFLLAYRIFPGSPSSLNVQETIVSAFQDKSLWRRHCGLPATNGIHLEGIGTLKADGGKEFVARSTRSCFAKLSINFENGAASSPHHRGKIEGVNSIISSFVCWLPGQLGKHSVDRKNRAEVKGELSLDELNKLFTIWVETNYHLEVSWGSHSTTRLQAVIQDQKSRALRAVPSSKLLESAITVSGYAMASRHGLRFENHNYNNDALTNFVLKFGNRRVEIVAYAHSVGAIDALLDGTWVSIPNTDHHFAEASLSAWRLHNACLVARGHTFAKASLPEVVAGTMIIQAHMNETMRQTGTSIPVNVSGDVLKLIDSVYETEPMANSTAGTRSNSETDNNVGIDMSEYE